ncbi:hypothetical protein HIM_02291 [Hirsutella minnesotensis 3608]|nr:hypothetical protein HIM_02291 [Hirsutella minnesotensis 3608]
MPISSKGDSFNDTNTPPSSTPEAKEFHFFPKLPAELRAIIWDSCLPPKSNVEPSVYMYGPPWEREVRQKFTHNQKASFLPSENCVRVGGLPQTLLFANREAQARARMWAKENECALTILPWAMVRPWNHERDILFVPHALAYYFFNYLPPDSKIRRLVTRIALTYVTFYGFLGQLRRALHHREAPSIFDISVIIEDPPFQDKRLWPEPSDVPHGSDENYMTGAMYDRLAIRPDWTLREVHEQTVTVPERVSTAEPTGWHFGRPVYPFRPQAKNTRNLKLAMRRALCIPIHLDPIGHICASRNISIRLVRLDAV